MDLPGVPNQLLEELREAAISLGIPRLALVGGVVHDQLLYQRLAVLGWCSRSGLGCEGDAVALAEELCRRCSSDA